MLKILDQLECLSDGKKADCKTVKTKSSLLNSNASKEASWTLTPCGATGKDGPTQSKCDAVYDFGSNNPQVTKGYQIFEVNMTGPYKIEAQGARGGNHGSGKGGFGAKLLEL